MLKVGWIDFLNTTVFNFEKANIKLNFNYRLVKGYPSHINELLRKGNIDVGAISSAEYIENFENYLILPDLSISAVNKVHSVAVFSNKPLDEIEEIHLSKASKSSRYLTKIVFKRFFNKTIKYKELEDYEDIGKKSVLLIGDNAIIFSKKFKYIYDLSEIWLKETGYPFVFALWAVKKDIFKSQKEEIIQFHKVLLLTKEKILNNLDKYIENGKINKSFAKIYLKSLDYSLKEKHINSLKLFSKYLKEENIINKLPEFNLLSV